MLSAVRSCCCPAVFGPFCAEGFGFTCLCVCPVWGVQPKLEERPTAISIILPLPQAPMIALQVITSLWVMTLGLGPCCRSRQRAAGRPSSIST